MATWNISIKQGETWNYAFTYGKVTDPDTDPPTYVPIDISDCSMRMQIRQAYMEPVLLELTSEPDGGIEIADDDSGEFTITMTADQTDTIEVKRAKYDLEIEFPAVGDDDPIVKRILEGTVTNSLNITRDEDE